MPVGPEREPVLDPMDSVGMAARLLLWLVDQEAEGRARAPREEG